MSVVTLLISPEYDDIVDIIVAIKIILQEFENLKNSIRSTGYQLYEEDIYESTRLYILERLSVSPNALELLRLHFLIRILNPLLSTIDMKIEVLNIWKEKYERKLYFCVSNKKIRNN